MAKKLRDQNGDEFGYLPFDLAAGEESATLILRVTAEAGAKFLSESHPDFQLLAREHGTLSPFVDLATGIDLSIYTAGASVQFDVKGKASSLIVGQVSGMVWLGVMTSNVAGWQI